ncbi:MAG: hypothetical protein H0U45_12755 [Tatlockia sp.]|nr:hypothetical protein [Tatlockia sp.]
MVTLLVKDFKRREADFIQPGITAAPCQFVPFEYVLELDRLWAARQGNRQKLLGE